MLKIRPWTLTLLLLLLLTISSGASAQQQMLPVYDKTGGIGCMIVVDSIRLSKQAYDASDTAISQDGTTLTNQDGTSPQKTVGLSMFFSLTAHKHLPKTDVVTLIPRLVSSTDSVDFPALRIYGSWAYTHLQRTASDVNTPTLIFPVSEALTAKPYSQHTPYQPWMEQAQLKLIVTQTDGCATEFRPNTRTIGETQMILSQRQIHTQTASTTQKLQGRAYIKFAVNKTDIRPELGNNRRELNKLYSVLDSLRKVENMDIRHIALKGFASPEGSYSHNEELSKGRVESLRQYLMRQYHIESALISTAYEPEDWQGLRDYVVEHTQLPGREQILAIIDTDDDPDRKLAIIASRYPQAYKQLNADAFPLLRHTDYSIDYSIKRGEDRNETQTLIDTTYVNTLKIHEEPLLPTVSHATKTYQPLLALKTNLLYDLAVAPNIEVEIALGRNARWSLMAEYCNPWWRWKKLDYAYEIQEGGLELRNWFSPRCNGGRPWLSGHFWGVYGAVAKYDLEYKQVGDQGEVFSGGLTYGHSWPLSPHWNLELSLSAGIVAGERRHYNAEFESTHLIYKYTKNLFYAGPTKLKVSLVWILGK